MPEIEQVPRGLRVMRSRGRVEVTAQARSASAIVVSGFCFSVSFAFLLFGGGGSTTLMVAAIFALFGVVFAYVDARDRRDSFRFVIEAATIRAKQQPAVGGRYSRKETAEQSIALADIARIYADSAKIELVRHGAPVDESTFRARSHVVDHLAAELFDGRSVRLLRSLRDPMVVPYLVDITKPFLEHVKRMPEVVPDPSGT